MATLCILPCGRKKIWDAAPGAGPTPAASAYTGALHKACRRYAEAFADRWVVLSAKHGFLLPEDIVPGFYDVGFQHKTGEVVAAGELKRQLRDKGLEAYRDVIVLGGRKFRNVLAPVYDETYRLRYPLSDCKGIGYMLQKLNAAVAESEAGAGNPSA